MTGRGTPETDEQYEPLDLGPDCHDWQTIGDLAKSISVSESSIYMALKDGRKTGGYTIEETEPDTALRDELGLDGRIKRVVRVVRDAGVSSVESDPVRRAEKRLAAEQGEVEQRSLVDELAAMKAERDQLLKKSKDLVAENNQSLDRLQEALDENTRLRADLDALKVELVRQEQEIVELEQLRGQDLEQLRERPRGSDADDSKWLPVLWNIAAGETHPEDVFELLRQHHLGRLP